MNMKFKSLYLSVLFLAVMLTGCQRDLLIQTLT